MAGPRLENLLERLAKGKAVPAIVLVGADPYLREQCREKLVEACVAESARAWAVASYSAAADGWQALLERARTVPMLSSRQVLFLEDAQQLERGSEEASEAAIGEILAYLDDPAPFSVVVLEADQLDCRRRLFKALSEKAILVELSLAAGDATAFVLETARALSAEIDPRAAGMLADVLGGEAARIRQELEKLAAYADGRAIVSADVDALVVSAKKYSVWQLADTLAMRDRKAALEFLDSLLREGEQPAGIVGALAWMYRKLIEARELSPQTNSFQAARELGMRPDAAELALRHARRVSREELLGGITALAEADNLLKSGVKSPRAVMEFLVARLTSAAAVTAG